MATKSVCNLENSNLKDIVNIKATLIGQWEITDHAIQLIAICTKLNYLYWIVPKCVVPIIMHSSHNDYELWILPDLFVNINTKLLTGGPFSVLSSQHDMVCFIAYYSVCITCPLYLCMCLYADCIAIAYDYSISSQSRIVSYS